MDSTSRMFLKAAARRLEAARALLGLNVMALNLDAMYLAGYSAECALKAMIIEATPRTERPERIATLTAGALAHNILYLRSVYQSTSGRVLPGGLNLRIVQTSAWSTDWRYESRVVATEVAAEFIEAAHAVLDHSRGQLA